MQTICASSGGCFIRSSMESLHLAVSLPSQPVYQVISNRMFLMSPIISCGIGKGFYSMECNGFVKFGPTWKCNAKAYEECLPWS
jgi:hypothetical protein